MSNEKEFVTVKIPKPLHRLLRIKAAETDTTLLDLITQAIKKFLGIK